MKGIRIAAAGIALVGFVGLGAAPAAADHDYDYGGYDDGGYYYREGCGEQGGGCGNERDEEYGDGSCKYFCPAFDRSPVEDSFNICLPGASCDFDGRRDGERERERERAPERRR